MHQILVQFSKCLTNKKNSYNIANDVTTIRPVPTASQSGSVGLSIVFQQRHAERTGSSPTWGEYVVFLIGHLQNFNSSRSFCYLLKFSKCLTNKKNSCNITNDITTVRRLYTAYQSGSVGLLVAWYR